ncbi:hypothetical protein pah_c009o031 [Parachlamydia acanthamoebae str. Hall's coccus]|nr:hypothetical protein pah_c009o031 [Parachlamydia acanthamoebae str. Hall's coccus]
MVSDFLKKDLGNLSSFFTVRDILPLQKNGGVLLQHFRKNYAQLIN